MHTILTFVAKVDPARLEDLNRILAEVAEDVAGNSHVPFGELTRVHFASLVVFPDDRYGPYLVFENNFDGPLDPYLDELIERAGAGLDRIYRCCLGYQPSVPPSASKDRASLRAYLRDHVVRPGAYHVGNVGRSAHQIRRERRLRDTIELHLDGLVRDGRATSREEVRREIQELVRADPSLGWAPDVRPRLTWLQKYGQYAVAAGALVALAATWRVVVPLAIPALGLWAAVLRWKEARDAVWSGLADHAHVQRLRDEEDRPRVVQNHMANLSHVKPGLFRRYTLRAVLFAANLLARRSTSGTLSGIPSIHFAHWSQIDGGKRLLFLSNYDGSWENYLDDFIDKASAGLTAIWGHTVEFPRVRWLIDGGSRDGPAFKEIARARQVPTGVWYSAYPDLTVQQIDLDSTIREQLFARLDDDGLRAWLRSF